MGSTSDGGGLTKVSQNMGFLADLLKEAYRGTIGVAAFQRPYVWRADERGGALRIPHARLARGRVRPLGIFAGRRPVVRLAGKARSGSGC